MQIDAATIESSMEIPQKNKNGSALWPNDSTSGNISEGTQYTNSEEHKHPYVHCGVIYKGQDMEAAQKSINRWVDKLLWDTYIMEYYSVTQKEENCTLCDSMDGTGEYYAKWNKPVKER